MNNICHGIYLFLPSILLESTVRIIFPDLRMQTPLGLLTWQLLSVNWLLFIFGGRPLALLRSITFSRALFAAILFPELCASKKAPFWLPSILFIETSDCWVFTKVIPARRFPLIKLELSTVPELECVATPRLFCLTMFC